MKNDDLAEAIRHLTKAIELLAELLEYSMRNHPEEWTAAK